MNTRLLWGGSLTLIVAAVAACGSSSDDAATGMPGAGGSGAAGPYNSATGGGYGYGANGGTGYAGSAGAYAGIGGAGEARPDGGAAGAAGADAGDAGDKCAALDDSKDAVFFLSADDSNSMASPAIVRAMLNDGASIPKHIIRTYEFLNYYNVGYAPAETGKLAIVPEMRAGETEGSFELTLGVASAAAPAARRPMVLTFVLDTSGSMAGEPISLQQEVVKVLAGELQKGDKVSVVTWNTSQAVLLDSHVATGPNDATLVKLATSTTASGGTDLSGGLQKGYQIAQKNFDANKLNRVIVISDGQANVGITDENIIGQGAQLNDGDGIYLVGVGVGHGVNDTLMDTVTDAGRGAYVFIDSAAEAKRMFDTRFDEVMDVAARAVQVELRLPWYMGIEKFYGEEYSTNPKEIEPQHLAPNDAMVFSQIVSACNVSNYSAEDPIEVVARWETPVAHLKQETSVQSTFSKLLATQSKYQDKAAAIIAYAEALKDPGVKGENLDAALAKVDAADPNKTDPELSEIRTLIGKAKLQY
ncbi:MAG: VWA domain-containing protein [Polyangiaceae bacterium]